MKYRFHYNGDLANEREDVEPGELTYHEHLVQQDGHICEAEISTGFRGPDGRIRVDAFFEDGNELTVYEEELEAIEDEQPIH